MTSNIPQDTHAERPVANPATAPLAAIAQPKGPASAAVAAADTLTRERVVYIMMALVAAAFAAMAHMQFGYARSPAAGSGIAAWVVFMVLHKLLKRSAETARLRTEILRLEQELARGRANQVLNNAKAAPAHAPRPNDNGPALKQPAAHHGGMPALQSAGAAAPTSGDVPYLHPPMGIEARWEGAKAGAGTKFVPAGPPAEPALGSRAPFAPVPQEGPAQRTAPRPEAAAAAAAPPDLGPALVDAPHWSGTSLSVSDPLRDAWSFRPREAATARTFQPDAGASDPAIRAAPSRTIEADLELVQRKIKALADEVNAAEAMKQQGQGSAPFAPGAAGIDESIAALRSAAGHMRMEPAAPSAPGSAMPVKSEKPQAPARAASRANTPVSAATAISGALPSLDTLIPATAEPIAGVPATKAMASPGATIAAVQAEHWRPTPQQRRIEDIAAAIEHRRMDVFLNPIVGLGDYAVTHFEVAVRLKALDGDYIERPEEILDIGARDILAMFDIERLNRTARVAEQLEARGKAGSVLSATSGQAMTDAKFLESFARTFEARNSIASQLVLTFAQNDVAAFGIATWQALEDMHSFGFRFALDKVTHLGIDFSDLAQKGFSFVKLPADAFLAGMAADGALVPAADICRHISGAGLTLVVEGVHEEATLARVFGFGALFGQGHLFGAARQISLEALAATRDAA